MWIAIALFVGMCIGALVVLAYWSRAEKEWDSALFGDDPDEP